MDMETLKGFFSQLFTALSNEDSIIIIIFLVGAFLIGLLFGWWQGRRGKRKLRKDLQQKEADFVSLQAAHGTLQEQLGLKEADLTKANFEVEELKTQISRIENEKAQLQSDMYTVSNQAEALKAENLAKLSEIEELNSEIIKLQVSTSQQAVLIDTAASNATMDVDLSAVQDNYDNANIRLAAIEEKLLRMDRENLSLRSEISSMKDSSLIAFVDDDPGDDDEELEIESAKESVEEGVDLDSADRSAIARQNLKAAFGGRITIASAEEKDDLKKINGVGPFIEQKLNDIDIYTFKQIGQFDADLIQQVTDAIQFFPGRIDRDDWVGQARRLS
ncbi:MAG: putative flap endonuclease-1-like 5' DNA nuclease [Saprospiraceae bacterium]|jgi:predicted flap endonuclease-1-like 5' DNA nuclease